MSRAVLIGSAAGVSLGLAVNAFLPLLNPTMTVYELSLLLTTYWQYPLYLTLFCLALNLYYRIFVKPLDGYFPLSHELRDRAMNRMNNKDLPPPFPTSWWKIMNSHELKIGESKPITFFGEELVIYRAAGDDKTGEGRGMVHILDGHCPHLGAHLGVGGKVVGNCIECPFHGWCFDGTGACTSIPYSDKSPPEQARVHSWPVCEVNHQIFVWYNADRKNPSVAPSSIEPSWKIPEISNVAQWKFHGEVVHEISCHVQEIPENGADVAHLTFLHGPFLLKFLPFLRHCWDATYTPLPEPNTHLATLNLKTAVSAFGKILGFTTVYSHILQVGPGIVHLEFPTIFGRVCAIETITPQYPYIVRACNLVIAEPWVPRFVAKFFLKAIQMQFERDVPIWCNKRYIRAPMQVKGDGPLLQYRRWFKQFYTQTNLIEHNKINSTTTTTNNNNQENQQESSNQKISSPSVAPAVVKGGLEW